jgi:hypothetical protein
VATITSLLKQLLHRDSKPPTVERTKLSWTAVDTEKADGVAAVQHVAAGLCPDSDCGVSVQRGASTA